MARQKLCGYDMKVKVNIQKALSLHLFTLQLGL